MPYTPEEARSQQRELNLSVSLQGVKDWLIGKKVPVEHSLLAVKTIGDFYSHYHLPTVAGSSYLAFGGKSGEYRCLYLWVYHFWPVAGNEATIDEMEQMNTLTMPFNREVSKPLRPHISVQPKFFGVIDSSAIDSLPELFQKACKKAKVDYVGVCQL